MSSIVFQAANPDYTYLTSVKFITSNCQPFRSYLVILAEHSSCLNSLLTTLFNKVSSCLPHNLTKRGSVEFVSSCVPHIATIFPCNKAGRVKIRHLGFVQTILQLYSDLPIGRGSNPLPSTVLVVRTYLDSVTLLADTYKTWCSRKDSNLHRRTTKPEFQPLKYQSKIGAPERNRTSIPKFVAQCIIHYTTGANLVVTVRFELTPCSV